MKIKNFLIIFTLFMVLLGGVSAISAASDNALDNLTSEMNTMDDSISVSNDENVVSVDDSALNTLEKNGEFNEQSSDATSMGILGLQSGAIALQNLGDSNSENVLDEGYVIYVGNHNKTETGNGSYENPFSTLKYACDNVSGQEKVTVKIFNGTYYMGSYLQFNTNDLNIKGIDGTVVVTYLFDTDEDGDHGEAFGLTSTSANFTISNIIFDGYDRTSYDGFFDAEDGYPDDPDAMGPYKSFFLPFYGYANRGTFNNCSFLFGSINTRLTGASEFKSRFINCYFDVTNDWHLLFYGGQIRDDNAIVAGYKEVTGEGPQFEYCSFNLPTIQRLVDRIDLPYSISINNSWFGQNNIPSYVGPYGGGYVAKPTGHWDFDWTVPVNRYAIFSVSENYLGNNQFEIVGKLTWNGTDSQEGMENFQPMTVKLSSDTGKIATTAILINGTFKANYTSQAPINKITATLDSQPLELEFYSVNISADAPSIYYGQDQNLTINFTQPIDATIVLTISNEKYNESYEIYVNNKDSFVYTIYDTLKEGIYTVDINLNDNKYYGENSTTLTISKISDYLFDMIIPSEAKVGGNATITLTLPEDVDGIVTIKFGNDTKILDANQTMTIDFNNLNATTYDINVTYGGSDKYASKEKIDSITIDKADSNVNVEDIAFTYGDVITIPFTVTNASGVNVRVLNKDGDEVTTTNSNGVEFTLETLPAGEYTLEVTTIVDEKNYYDFTVDDIVLTINKAESSLTLNNSYEFIYGQDAVINVVTENSTGDVIVSLVGEDDFTASVSGNEINLPALNTGKYTLTVTTNVDDNHNNITKSTTITIAKANPSMNVIVKLSDNVTVKDNITLIINLPSDATGEVVVKINGKKTDTIHANETITINLNNKLAGECIVDIIYSGDKNYESDSATKEFTISKAEAPITAEQTDSEEGTATIEVTISDVNSGIILVDVDGKKFYGDINNGKATINVEGVPEGNYTANIKFFGDDKYNSAATTADIKITEDKIITDLKEQLEEANAKVDNLTAELNESQANATKLSEDLADANAKVDNLTVELEKAKLLPTQFNVTNGFKLQVYAVDYKAGERGEMFNVLLTDSNGNPLANQTVFFAINGWVHNKTTDANGVAHLQINLQDANYYTCAPCYLGNTSYNATFASAMLEVVKKPITISAAAKSYKATAKTKKYTVTLKTIKGSSADGKTYLSAGKKVTLKVNGKTYTAKINAKGQATFNLKITKKGKYDATIKFAGDKTYNSASKKVKITIK